MDRKYINISVIKSTHKTAKINAVKLGMNLSRYIEMLVMNDNKRINDWETRNFPS